MKKISLKETATTALAEAAFKPRLPTAPTLSEQALETEAFHKNRERLKAERLAREELSKRK